MPNRILKESICTSDNLNELSEEAENFFYRLLVCCDDFGRFDGRPAIIKARCYPLKETKSTEMILSYLQMLQAQEIIIIYQVDGKPYIQMQTWDKHQQVRAKKSKFPAPDPDLISDDIRCEQLIENVPVIQSNPIQPEYEYESNPKPAMIPFEDIRMAFNKFCPSLPNATIVTPLRRDSIKQIWFRYEQHEGGPLAFFDTLFKKTEASDLLAGRTKRGRWCGFDWILEKDHPVKIIEGVYDNSAPEEPVVTSPAHKTDVFDALKGVR